MKMATKKIGFLDAEDFPMPSASTIVVGTDPNKERHDFAVAALQTLDWNQIGMGVDQAAQLCWKMAEAMVRHKP
jgi:hypothetical protein